MGTISKKQNFVIGDCEDVLKSAANRFEEEMVAFLNAKAGTPHKGMPSYKKILKAARAEYIAKKINKENKVKK